MEELEKNETSTQAEENTVSLASAQALADALAKIEVYTPTTWVDNSSPDIDAEHLNKPEQAIKRVTDALNSAVDVIKDLQSQVTKNAGDISTVNNNLSNKFINVSDKGYTQLSQLMDVGAWSKSFVFEIPYTSPIAPATNNTVGIAERGMLHAFDYSGKHFYCNDSSKGWQSSPYALKSDLSMGRVVDQFTAPTNTKITYAHKYGNIVALTVVISGIKDGWNTINLTTKYELACPAIASISKTTISDKNILASCTFDGTSMTVLSSSDFNGDLSANFILLVKS